MFKPQPQNTNQEAGFSLIELIVVLAGLGILSSLAIPNIGRLLDFNNIDEAKALLNTAAADCLQRSRYDNYSDTVDNEMLSVVKIKKIGYKFETGSDKCSYLVLTPTNEDDKLRYPIGFSVSEDQPGSGYKLRKTANPTSSDAGSLSSCEKWAGANCKQDEELKALIAYRNEIRAAEKKCTDSFNSKTAGDDVDGLFTYWNPTATIGCPTKPPKVVSETCTTGGCNKKTYFYKGKNLYTDDPLLYRKAREADLDANCLKWEDERRNNKTDNQRDEYVTNEFCKEGAKKYWFCNGEDRSDKDSMNLCLIEKENARCKLEKEERLAAKTEGKFSPSGSTLECQDVWFCFKDKGNEANPYTSADVYNDKCKNDEPPPPPPKKCTESEQRWCDVYGIGCDKCK